MNIQLDHLKPIDFQGECRDSRHAWVGSSTRYVWTVCAAVSLWTSRYILVDSNLNYPLYLHVVQLGVTTVVALLQSLLLSGGSSDEEGQKRPSRSRVLEWLYLILVTSLMSGAMALNMQAVLHFSNLTTLVMMSTISYLVKLILTDRSRLKWLQCLILTLSCVGILGGEYRLFVLGLISSIPAALIAGLAGALHAVAADFLPNAVSNPRRTNVLFCITGLAMTGTWAYRTEDRGELSLKLDFSHLPLLAINSLSTAGAILLGKSFLLPMGVTVSRPCSESGNQSRIGDAVTMLALSGIVGCVASSVFRRGYTTYVQVFAFLVALLSMCGHSVLETMGNWRRDTHQGYALLDPLESMDREDTSISGNTSTTSKSAGVPRRGFTLRSLLVGFTVAALWLAFIILNFDDRLHVPAATQSTALDRKYVPTVETEIVISMYKEAIPSVAYLVTTLLQMPNLADARVHIYVKDADADLEVIRQGTGANKVTLLPNIGREGETYLNHIVHEWDNLAKHTVFLQADVHNPREFYPRIRKYFDPARTGMMSLGWSGAVCNCETCGDRMKFLDTTSLVPELHGRIYGNQTACEHVLLSYKGQFIASGARIRGIDKKIYEDLRDAFVDKDSWAHREPYLRGRGDSMSAPAFGYTMERLWNLMMQCDASDATWKCPSMLSGDRIGGGIGDCQCFDA
ncbi:hypothetical protein K504DRAFT_384257 [Pleomassaria siparia CBS 279.74]|uniref:Uncharacterized protein n=1 Tax=Pleomassaria siparia CBS 279.74 TaxID=1314801 RepID=A0A6G1K388_9PLEO|nr:hypothetical protein K504DRAFT_384257 [Pleomassaria siparia CBS 279.74]